MTFTLELAKRRWRALLLVIFGAMTIWGLVWAAGSAHADYPAPEPPQPSVPFTFPTLTIPIPGTLQQQADELGMQAQITVNDAIRNTQKEVLTAVTNLTQPAPAAIPAVAPAVPPVISPEIDKAITDTLPASLPELTQQVVDPVYEAVLSTIFGVPAKMPEIERMDKNTPLSTQIGAAIDLFAVKDITPDLNACGGESIEAKTACGAGVVADNVPDGESITKINLVSRYGVEAWITPWGNICGGYISSMAYCGEIYASKYMFTQLAADPNNITQSEVTLVLAHENQHGRDAIAFEEKSTDVFKYGPNVFNSGPGAFFAHTQADTANEFHYEQRADSGGMTIVRAAVEKGQLPPEAVEQGYALLGRIGYTMPDGSSEPTHGSSEDRIAAGRRDIEEFDKEDALIAAA